jgi:hypothetical protein
VGLQHELQRSWANCDDHVWLAILILAKIRVAELLLSFRIRKQYCFHVLAIELKPIWCVLQPGTNSLINGVDRVKVLIEIRLVRWVLQAYSPGNHQRTFRVIALAALSFRHLTKLHKGLIELKGCAIRPSI